MPSATFSNRCAPLTMGLAFDCACASSQSQPATNNANRTATFARIVTTLSLPVVASPVEQVDGRDEDRIENHVEQTPRDEHANHGERLAVVQQKVLVAIGRTLAEQERGIAALPSRGGSGMRLNEGQQQIDREERRDRKNAGPAHPRRRSSTRWSNPIDGGAVKTPAAMPMRSGRSRSARAEVRGRAGQRHPARPFRMTERPYRIEGRAGESHRPA